MKGRQLREREYRRIFVAGIGVSLAIHAVVLGVSEFTVPAETAGPADTDRRATPEADRTQAIELVELAVLEEPTEAPEPVEAVVAAAAEPDAVNPAAASPASARATPSPAAGAPSSTRSVAAILASLKAPAAPSMRANFAARQSLPYGASASQPIPAAAYADPHAGHDHGEDDESEGDGWWGRFKVALGQGAGGYCKPRKPPVLVSGPNQPPVLGGVQPEDDTERPDAQFPRPRGPGARVFR